MDDVNVQKQACCAFRYLFLKLVEMKPFWQTITISSICHKIFRTMSVKPDSVGIIPRGATVWGITSLLRLFNCWRTLLGRITMLLVPVMGGKFIWPGYLMWKLMGTLQRRMTSRYLGCFWHGCLCMRNRHKPIGKTGNFAEQVQGI